MEGSTDRGLFGFGHKDEEKHQQQQHGTTPYGTQPAGVEHGGYGAGAQHQPLKTEHGSSATETYSAAPGVPAESHSHGEGGKQGGGMMQKVEHTLGVDKLKEKAEKKKAGHKKSGSSSSSSSDEEEGEKKKKLGIF